MKTIASYYPKNNLVLARRIVELGYPTKKEFCEDNNLSYQWLRHLNSDGVGPIGAVRIAKAARTTVEYLFVTGRK